MVKGDEGTFLAVGNILYLDCDGGYITVYLPKLI